LNRFGREQNKTSVLENKTISQNQSTTQTPSIQLKNDTTTTTNNTTKTISNKKEPIINGISNKIVKAYVDAMYQSFNPDGKSVEGINKIRVKAKELYNASISEPKAKKIYGYLENTGIIKPEGKSTIVLKSRNSINI
jgi:hypothetical protein